MCVGKQSAGDALRGWGKQQLWRVGLAGPPKHGSWDSEWGLRPRDWWGRFPKTKKPEGAVSSDVVTNHVGLRTWPKFSGLMTRLEGQGWWADWKAKVGSPVELTHHLGTLRSRLRLASTHGALLNTESSHSDYLQIRSKEILHWRISPLTQAFGKHIILFREDFDFCRINTFFFFSPQAYFSPFSKGWVLVGNLIHMFMIHFNSTPFKFIFGAWVGTWEAF